jgi:hypothetical protein
LGFNRWHIDKGFKRSLIVAVGLIGTVGFIGVLTSTPLRPSAAPSMSAVTPDRWFLVLIWALWVGLIDDSHIERVGLNHIGFIGGV